MKSVRLITAVVVVALCSACSPGAPTAAEAAASSASAAAQIARALGEPTAATTSLGGVLRPTPDQESRMAAALLKIDPRMNNADRYVGRTIDTCHDIRSGELNPAELRDRVQFRFQGGTMPDFTDSQAQQVIDMTKYVWCSAG